MNRKIVSVVVVAVLIALAGLNQLGRSKPLPSPVRRQAGYPFELVDSYQRRVTLQQEPQRIISVAPNITEILFALGKGKLLVGRTDYCDFPPQAARIASVGSLQEPSLEKIVALKPDLVIVSTHFKKEVVVKLEELGIKVVVLYGPESSAGVYSTIGKVGEAVNARPQAVRLVADLKRQISGVTSRIEGLKRPKVYYVVSFGKAGDYTAGAGTFIGDLLELAGGENVARDSHGWLYSREKLVQQNPDLIICSKYYQTRQALEKTPGYRELPAVKAGRLMEIDNNLLDRQGPRIAEGVEALARLIHPEVFPDVDKEKAHGK